MEPLTCCSCGTEFEGEQDRQHDDGFGVCDSCADGLDKYFDKCTPPSGENFNAVVASICGASSSEVRSAILAIQESLIDGGVNGETATMVAQLIAVGGVRCVAFQPEDL